MRIALLVVLGVGAYALHTRRPKVAPPFIVDASAEAQACGWVLTERPTSWEGLKLDPARPLADWLGWIAYRRAYPHGPKHPRLTTGALAWEEAQGRLRLCVAAQIGL